MRCAIDWETWLIGPGRAAPCGVSLAVAWYRADGSIDSALHVGQEAARVAHRIVADPSNHIVGLNLPFDLSITLETIDPSARPAFIADVFRAYDECRITSVDVREQLRLVGLGHLDFDPAIGCKPTFSLAAMARKWLGLDLSADKTKTSTPGWQTAPSWRLRYYQLDGVPVSEWPEEARRYALDDAIHTLRIDSAQLAADGGREWPDKERQERSAFALYLTSLTGYRSDAARIQAVEAKNVALYNAITRDLVTAGICDIEGKRNMEAISARVTADYALRGLPPPRTDPSEYTAANRAKFPDGKIEVAREVLAGCKDAALQRLAERGIPDTYLTKYIPRLKEGIDWPINVRYNNLVATGRTSSGEQQHPREGGIRECIRAREGNVLISCDYSIAELRGLAQVNYSLFGWSKMRDALIAGRELHIVTAAMVLSQWTHQHVSYEDALARYKAKDKMAKNARQLAKAGNFGIPGGLGAEAFCEFAKAQYGVELDVRAAADFKRNWLDLLYPEVRELFRLVTKWCAQGVNGRYQAVQWASGRLRGDTGFCDGCNTMFQGIVADFAKSALYEVCRACFGASQWGVYDPLYNYRPILFYHDEIVIEGRESSAHEAAVRLQEIMEGEGRKWCPDVPILAEPALCYHYSKEAAPAFDAVGRLIPYERAAQAR